MALVQSGLFPITEDDYIYNFGDYDANGNPTYIGKANPGTADSATGWKIIKLTYDGDGNVLTKMFPKSNNKITGTSEQNNGMNFIWDSRASYTYTA